jgi:hypothetical protein
MIEYNLIIMASPYDKIVKRG